MNKEFGNVVLTYWGSIVADYMEFYNYRRFHETLGYKKPMNVYFDSLQINDENYTENVVAVS